MDEQAAAMGISNNCLKLPPGFRFSPTDEELILHFLYPKSSSSSTSSSMVVSHSIIPDLLAFRSDPWDLHGKAFSSGNQFFYFSWSRQNRCTRNGYWKDLEMEEPIFSKTVNGLEIIGAKKLLAFHIGGNRRRGTATLGPGEEITNWVMEEYRLIPKAGATNGSTTATINYSYNKKLGKHRQAAKEKGSLVLCRVHEREIYGSKQPYCCNGEGEGDGDISSLDEMFLSLDDDLDDVTSPY